MNRFVMENINCQCDRVMNKRSSGAVRREREQKLEYCKKQPKTLLCTFFRDDSISIAPRNFTSQVLTCRETITIFVVRNHRFANSVSFCHGAAKRHQKNFLRCSQCRWRIGSERTRPQKAQAPRLQAQEEAS